MNQSKKYFFSQFSHSITVLDIVGKGDLESVGSNTRMRMKMYAKKYEKDGKTFVKYEKVTARIQPNKSTIKLTNLFNGEMKIINEKNKKNKF